MGEEVSRTDREQGSVGVNCRVAWSLVWSKLGEKQASDGKMKAHVTGILPLPTPPHPTQASGANTSLVWLHLGGS